MTRGLTSSERALNRQKAPAKNSRKKLKNTAAVIASSIAIALATTSCKGAAEKYESGEAEQEIAANQAAIDLLIEQYNDYFTDYEKCFDDMVALQAAGDIGGYKKVFKKREKLEERIKEIEKQIDKKSMKTLDLSDKFYKGKQKAEEEKARNTSSFGDYQPAKLQRRTFLEDGE
ncbi:MAG: hypothetical protein ACFN4U_03200 [Candidatus Absconditicoccaceae bacterium]